MIYSIMEYSKLEYLLLRKLKNFAFGLNQFDPINVLRFLKINPSAGLVAVSRRRIPSGGGGGISFSAKGGSGPCFSSHSILLKTPLKWGFFNNAEEVGFEPTIPCGTRFPSVRNKPLSDSSKLAYILPHTM